MTAYWVVGGEYEDTRFDRIVAGREQRFGPFPTYEAAKAEWQRHAWATVDNAHARYAIEEDAPEAGYWVVGGAYKDTSFREPVGEERWIGPFASYEDARREWARLAWASVDDALTRYRIDKSLEPHRA